MAPCRADASAAPRPRTAYGASDRTIPEVLDEQAALLTVKPFLQVWRPAHGVVLTLSFAEVLRRVAAAERALLARGVAHGQRVALLSHPTVPFFLYSLALLGLGAVGVILNWRMAPPALLATLELSQARTLVGSARLAEAARYLQTHSSLPLWWLEPPPQPRAEDSALPALDGAALPPDASSSPPLPPRRPVATDVAVIMFTSGSTSTPKAVPLTHGGLLWNCAQRLRMQPDAFAAPNAGTLSLLPNFHVIGFTNNFLFNLFAGVRCVVQADAGSAPLSARLMLEACACTRPTVLDTVPWLVEELLALLDGGEEEAGCLARLHFILAGGCALNAAVLLPQLRRHGVKVWPHYGQTELGGPALVGGLEGDLAAMRPLPGVRYELEGADGQTGVEEGELVLIGMHSATEGYLPGSNGRRLQGHAPSTAARFYTGDVFRVVEAEDGGEWLVHVCRQDDLLVHSTGEMTNPLPIEAALHAQCAHVASALCLIGQRQPRPFLVIEPKQGVAPDAARAAVIAALPSVNAAQPGYSHLAAAAVLCAHAPLAKSAKGNVVRPLVEAAYTPAMEAVRAGGATDGEGSAADGEPADSIALVDSAAARPSAGGGAGHMYCLAMLHVLLHHNEALWGGGPLCAASAACNPAVRVAHDLLYPVAIPTFLMLAGAKDAHHLTSPLKLATHAALLLAVGALFFYWVPSAAHAFWNRALELEGQRWEHGGKHARQIGARLGATLIHIHTYQWFFFVLAIYKLVAIAAVPFRQRAPYLLPLLTLVLHFASYADVPWPLMRNPVSYRPESNPMASLEEKFLLPVMAKLTPLWPFYAALPLALPAGFPSVLPLQRALERRHVPAAATRALWAALFLSLASIQPYIAAAHPLNLKADTSPMMVAYGCKEEYFRPFNSQDCEGGRPHWAIRFACLDLLHLALVAAMTVGFGACVPRAPSRLSAAGERTLFCYLLHVPLTPLIQSSAVFALLEYASPSPSSYTRGLAVLGYMLAVQLALSRKPSLPSLSMPSYRAVHAQQQQQK
ncbi:hypothetical protein AB1Y20_000265 [Prymnesium parvum]|uniref:AMP-dependent synthetase/ligase domain-containing protein n=1 Tax=Prymnesium parvum TaxID=97485 RepID=A0AB34K4V0_PRYPA